MSRRWFLIVPVLLVTFLLFQNLIVFKTVEWTLHKSFQEAFSQDIKWDSIERKGATVIIRSLRVGSGDKIPFEAEQMTLHWDFQIFNPSLTINIELSKPKIDVSKLHFDMAATSEKGWLSMVKLQGSLIVQDLEILHSAGKSNLNLNIKSFDEKKLVMALEEFRSNEQGGSRLDLSVAMIEGEGEARVKANEFSLSFLSELKEALFPSLFDKEISKGILNGNGAFHFSSNLAPQVEGKFKVYDLVLEDPVKDFYFSAGLIDCDLKPSPPLAQSKEVPWLPSLSGKITVQNGNRFKWGQNPDKQFQAEAFQISAVLKEHHRIELESQGTEIFRNTRKPFELKGVLDVTDFESIALEFDYVGDLQKEEQTQFSARGEKLGSESGLLKLSLKNFGIQHFTLIENILKTVSPELTPVEFQKGKVDAQMHLGFDKASLTFANLKEISLRNVLCSSDEWGCDFGGQNFNGFISMDFRHPNPSETFAGELLVIKGFLKLKTLSEELWSFQDIETKLVIKEGALQRSLATASLAGLSGKTEIDWNAVKDPLKMEFSGKGSDLAPFMPDRVRSGIERRSMDDEVKLNLHMARDAGRMHFKGELILKDPFQGSVSVVDYGFELKAPQKHEEASFKDFLYWFKEAPETLPDLLAPYGTGLASLLISEKQSETGVFGYKLANGWFNSKGVSLKKYLSSYLFRRDDIVLSGSADFKGAFDLKGAYMSYTAENLLLESGKLRMEMAEIPGRKEGIFSGFYQFDFGTGEHRGEMPIQGANYYDKIKGLFFDRIEGKALFHEKKVFLPDLETFLNGVYVKGSLLLDNTDDREGFFDLYTHLDQLEGSLEALNRSLERVDSEILLLKVPMSGQVRLNSEGADITLNVFQDQFFKDDFLWNAKISGALSQGTLEVTPLGLEATGVNLGFNYDKSKDYLQFSDFTGTLIVGKEGAEQEINFLVDDFTLKSLETKEGIFSVSVYDKEGDILALKGILNPEANGKLSFLFESESSHVMGDSFKSLELLTEGFSRVSSAEIGFNLSLPNLAKKLIHLSPDLKDHLSTLKGNFKTTVTYDEIESKLLFKLNGEAVSFSGNTFEKALLEGQFHEGVFSIHNGVFDDYIFSVDLLKQDSEWVLRHLGVKIKDALLLGAEGKWEEGTKSLVADVNHAEIVLDKLEGFDEMKPFSEEFQPKGRLKGNGKIVISFENKTPELIADLKTQSKNVQFNGLYFKDLEPSLLHFELGKGVELSDLKTALLDPISKNSLIDFTIDKVAIQFESDTTEIEMLKYDVLAENLGKLSGILQKAFPDMVTPFVKESLSNLKSEGRAVGTMGLTLTDTETHFNATLQDGKWHFLDWDSDLKHFRIELDSDEVKLSTQYLLEDKPIWILARTPRPNFDSGVVLIAESGLEEEPITLHWVNRGSEGLRIIKAEGSALGLNLALKEDSSHPTTALTHRLRGEVEIDLSRASILLSHEIKQKITSLGLAEGWGLKGLFELEKEEGSSGRAYTFKGDLQGNKVVAYNHLFERLFGHVNADENEFNLTELVLEDPSGTLYIKEGNFKKDEKGLWHVDIPLLAGYDLRPSLLGEKGKKKPKEKKPLVVKEFQIQDLKGPLANLSEVTGKGVLSFVNPQKKNLQNTIFAIPSDILSRIGIDLVALTPVTGTISFDISDEKVWFTKFKDVHSEGKLSKFYLANPKIPSYMDFTGDLHLQIKMRQYTLLFKLAELFIFNIEGTISKPTYSLNKGSK